jgi:GDP-4-dehydro-6-deoxy-D-mannose reductase
VTGAAGFAGRHLVQLLLEAGHRVVTTDIGGGEDLPGFIPAELGDRAAMVSLVRATRPDACIHLAAISFVPDGDRDPSRLLTINVAGTLNLLDALRAEAPRARLLFISSAQIYGPAPSVSAANVPIPENTPSLPLTLYAISKVAAERAVFAYGSAYGMDVMAARPANHTGPHQSPRFVAAAFARQVKEFAAGRIDQIRVGNLDAVRDFTDVRDVVRAYRLILERGVSGLPYNISSNTHMRIGDLLERLQALTGVSAPVTVDPDLVRPADASIRLDVSRLRQTTAWTPAFRFDDTLRDMLAASE